MSISNILDQLLAKKNLSSHEVKQILNDYLETRINDIQMAAFLVLMRMKGETSEELSSAASLLLDKGHLIDLGSEAIDIVGTGGDHKNTFNVSTLTSFVVAAAGAKVAKHGNVSVSSKSGSADFLLEAGFKLDLSDKAIKQCYEQCGLCFLFAPHFHPALSKIRAVRKELGIRTFFNLLGPLLNPALVKKQVVGVFNEHWQAIIAKVLVNLGSQRCFVIHSLDGMDEVSIAAKTKVVEYHHGEYKTWELNPLDFDCYHANIDKILVQSAKESLNLAKEVLRGQKGPARDIVVLNSALALYCAEKVKNIDEGVKLACTTIDSQKALHLFSTIRQLTIG